MAGMSRARWDSPDPELAAALLVTESAHGRLAGEEDPTHGMAADHGGGRAGWDRARQLRAQDKGQARQAELT